MKYSKQELIESIQEDREEVLIYYYKALHQNFFGWASKRYSVLSYTDIEEVYNDAWLVLCDAIKVKGKIIIIDNVLTGLWSSVLAYLKGVANNLFLNLLRDKEKNKQAEVYYLQWEQEENTINETVLEKAFKQLKIRWKRLFYYKFIMQLKYDFIAEILPAKNGHVVKAEMVRAKNNLRELYRKEQKMLEQQEVEGMQQSDTKHKNNPQQAN